MASIICEINRRDRIEAELLKAAESDCSSASPAASGSSYILGDIDDEYSSAETTPPPENEHYGMADGVSTGRSKRHSGVSSTYSPSYQSAATGSFPADNSLSQYSHYASPSRSSTSGYAEGIDEEEERDLTTAVSTSCKVGTPKSGSVYLPRDAPPVPPLPAQYFEEHQRTKSGNFPAQAGFGLPTPSYLPLSYERGVPMVDHSVTLHRHGRDHVYNTPSHSKNDEDEGVFGSMEGLAHDNYQDLS